MKNHLIDVVLTPETLTTLTDTIATLNANVAEFSLSMDRAQRKRHAKLGLRNETFSRAILDLAGKRPEIVPATIDVAAVQRDLSAREQLLPLLWQLKSLTLLLENTTVALGIDIYEATRGIYKAAKVTAGISGTTAVLQEIGKRFANQGRRKPAAPKPIATSAVGTDKASRSTVHRVRQPRESPLGRNPGTMEPGRDFPERQSDGQRARSPVGPGMTSKSGGGSRSPNQHRPAHEVWLPTPDTISPLALERLAEVPHHVQEDKRIASRPRENTGRRPPLFSSPPSALAPGS
jgi:hypothetical protein